MIKKILVIVIIVLLLVLYFVSELNKKQAQNWKMNFNGISKDPYGCYVLRKTLKENSSLNLKTTNQTLYKLLSETKKKTSTILIITDQFEPDSINLSAAYKFVDAGNKIFISSYLFNKRLSDSLNFEINSFNLFSFKDNKDTLNLVNPTLKFYAPASFLEMSPSFFTAIDTNKHWVLGTTKAGFANYIKIPYGRGAFYIHCQPLAFTNFHLLYSNSEYPYSALSYFKNDTLIWDDYYKPQEGKYTYESQTPFRYFLSQNTLRMALYLTLLLIAIYFLVESKRKQRAVPIFEPHTNSTIKFVSTIARLYQGQPDYKKMAQKKFMYLKEMAYSLYLIRLDENDENTAVQFSEKTGYKLADIKDLYITYRRIESSISIDAETLITLSAQVDEIYEFEKEK